MAELDHLAKKAFADGGISLSAVPERDFAWSHDSYQKTDPDRKDIEVRICVGNYMGKVVRRETVKNVHFEDADKVAQGILDKYKEAVRQVQLVNEQVEQLDVDQESSPDRPRT